MKTYLISTLSSLAALVLMGACATSDQYVQNQEYDDLYFTAKDRNMVEVTKLNEPNKAQYNNKGSYIFDQESYSSKNVNPDLITQYQNQENEAVEGEGEYYVEEYERADYQTHDQPRITNNFYGQPYSTFGNSFYGRGFHDPFYSSFYDPFYSSFYDPFWGPSYRPGFSARFNLGFAFGSPWGYRPYSPWGSRMGWGSPYGYGYDPFYASYYDPYYSGFYNGYYGRPGVVIINNNGEGLRSNRLTTYGRSPMRTSRLTNDATNETRRTVRNSAGTASNNDRVVANERTRSSYGTRSARTSSENVTKTYNELNQRRSSSTSVNRDYSSATPAARSNRSYTPADATRSRSGNSGSYTRTRSSRPSNYSNSPSYERSRSNSYGRSSSPSYGSSPSRSSSGSSYGTRSSGSYNSSGNTSGSSRSSGGSSRSSRSGNR